MNNRQKIDHSKATKMGKARAPPFDPDSDSDPDSDFGISNPQIPETLAGFTPKTLQVREDTDENYLLRLQATASMRTL